MAVPPALIIARNYLDDVAKALSLVDYGQVYHASQTLLRARKELATVWLVGNGGSAATASHFAGDLRKEGLITAIALPDLTPTVLAYGNDDSWDRMFSRPLSVMMKPKDVLVAITCGGKSPNVLNAAGRVEESHLIILTGNPDWGNTIMRCPASAVIRVPVGDIRIQEDVHVAVCHAIVGILRASV